MLVLQQFPVHGRLEPWIILEQPNQFPNFPLILSILTQLKSLFCLACSPTLLDFLCSECFGQSERMLLFFFLAKRNYQFYFIIITSVRLIGLGLVKLKDTLDSSVPFIIFEPICTVLTLCEWEKILTKFKLVNRILFFKSNFKVIKGGCCTIIPPWKNRNHQNPQITMTFMFMMVLW